MFIFLFCLIIIGYFLNGGTAFGLLIVVLIKIHLLCQKNWTERRKLKYIKT